MNKLVMILQFACGVFVLIRFVVFLRVLYRDGRVHHADLTAARGAQILPLFLLVIVLVGEVLLMERFEGLIKWIPSIIGLTALLGALIAVERARSAVLARR